MNSISYLHAAEVLKVMAHPVRLKIIEILKGGQMSVTDIYRHLNIKQSAASQHLNSMRNKNILQSRRDGNVVFYSISNRNILKIINCIQSCQK